MSDFPPKPWPKCPTCGKNMAVRGAFTCRDGEFLRVDGTPAARCFECDPPEKFKCIMTITEEEV